MRIKLIKVIIFLLFVSGYGFSQKYTSEQLQEMYHKNTNRIKNYYENKYENLQNYKKNAFIEIQEELRVATKGSTPAKKVGSELYKQRIVLENLTSSYQDSISKLSSADTILFRDLNKSIYALNNDITDINLILSIIGKGIKGDSLFSESVVNAQARAIELLKKYDTVVLESNYRNKINRLKRNYHDEITKIDDNQEKLITEMFEEENKKTREQAHNLLADISNKENRLQALQDSIDSENFKAIGQSEFLDSLIFHRNNLAQKSMRLISEIDDYQNSINKDTLLLVMELLNKTEQSYIEGNYEAARNYCLETIKMAPTYDLIHVRLGSIFMAEGNSEKAMEAWNMALTINPDNNELKRFIILNGLRP